jgi:uncharacterized protein YecE (DUF72 family)
LSPAPRPHQQDLFGAPSSDEWAQLVRAAEVSAELTRLARRLPQNLKLGTSSWSYSGWQGIVYAGPYKTSTIARHGLAAYAQHPLLTGVGLDRTFYSPVTVAELAEYAAVVPPAFRFVAKAYTALTTDPQSARAGRSDIEPAFLDASLATREVIAPLVEGFGDKLGAVLFQFSPLSLAITQAPSRFVDQLGAFLEALPAGVNYAVELRDPEILGTDYEAMLRQTGATHCTSAHPRMPPVDEQVTESLQGPLVIRWMLHPTQEYEAAAVRYAPFDRLVDPDPDTRGRIVKLIHKALGAGRDVHMVATNKAEGSAPLTIFEIARAVAARSDVGTGSWLKP